MKKARIEQVKNGFVVELKPKDDFTMDWDVFVAGHLIEVKTLLEEYFS